VSHITSGYIMLVQVMSGYFRLGDVRICKAWFGRVNPG
jgi:hypothetical protein